MAHALLNLDLCKLSIRLPFQVSVVGLRPVLITVDLGGPVIQLIFIWHLLWFVCFLVDPRQLNLVVQVPLVLHR